MAPAIVSMRRSSICANSHVSYRCVSVCLWGSLLPLARKDRDIQDILSEELQAYYAGDRTLDDTIKLINDRVTVYINEVK